jgi:hypothetical protein
VDRHDPAGGSSRVIAAETARFGGDPTGLAHDGGRRGYEGSWRTSAVSHVSKVTRHGISTATLHRQRRSEARMPARAQYQVRVVGRVGPAASEIFADYGVRVEPTATVLSGALDQAALHGLLARVRGLGLELVDVHRVRPKR